jgi:hypothetical protein
MWSKHGFFPLMRSLSYERFEFPICQMSDEVLSPTICGVHETQAAVTRLGEAVAGSWARCVSPVLPPVKQRNPNNELYRKFQPAAQLCTKFFDLFSMFHIWSGGAAAYIDDGQSRRKTMTDGLPPVSVEQIAPVAPVPEPIVAENHALAGVVRETYSEPRSGLSSIASSAWNFVTEHPWETAGSLAVSAGLAAAMFFNRGRIASCFRSLIGTAESTASGLEGLAHRGVGSASYGVSNGERMLQEQMIHGHSGLPYRELLNHSNPSLSAAVREGAPAVELSELLASLRAKYGLTPQLLADAGPARLPMMAGEALNPYAIPPIPLIPDVARSAFPFPRPAALGVGQGLYLHEVETGLGQLARALRDPRFPLGSAFEDVLVTTRRIPLPVINL